MSSSRSGTLTRGLAAIILAVVATPAFADDRVLITQYEQQLSDAISNGLPAVWDKFLNPDVIYAEEDGSYKGKAEMVKEVRPLPKGLGGPLRSSFFPIARATTPR
jgi:hypothetical protein